MSILYIHIKRCSACDFISFFIYMSGTQHCKSGQKQRKSMEICTRAHMATMACSQIIQCCHFRRMRITNLNEMLGRPSWANLSNSIAESRIQVSKHSSEGGSKCQTNFVGSVHPNDCWCLIVLMVFSQLSTWTWEFGLSPLDTNGHQWRPMDTWILGNEGLNAPVSPAPLTLKVPQRRCWEKPLA